MKTKITVPTYPIICVASVISSATTGICASSMGSSTSGVSLQKCRPWVPSSTRFQIEKGYCKNENDRDRVRREEGLEIYSIQEGRRKLEVKRES